MGDDRDFETAIVAATLQAEINKRKQTQLKKRKILRMNRARNRIEEAFEELEQHITEMRMHLWGQLMKDPRFDIVEYNLRFD